MNIVLLPACSGTTAMLTRALDVTYKENAKEYKFKARTSNKLYTLVLDDAARAKKVKESIGTSKKRPLC